MILWQKYFLIQLKILSFFLFFYLIYFVLNLLNQPDLINLREDFNNTLNFKKVFYQEYFVKTKNTSLSLNKIFQEWSLSLNNNLFSFIQNFNLNDSLIYKNKELMFRLSNELSFIINKKLEEFISIVELLNDFSKKPSNNLIIENNEKQKIYSNIVETVNALSLSNESINININKLKLLLENLNPYSNPEFSFKNLNNKVYNLNDLIKIDSDQIFKMKYNLSTNKNILSQPKNPVIFNLKN